MTDREKLKDLIQDGHGYFYSEEYKGLEVYDAMAEYLLANGVTIKKYGRWERYYYSYFGQHQCVCSECKDSEYWKRYYCYGVESYCPNCGVKMDLEMEE